MVCYISYHARGCVLILVIRYLVCVKDGTKNLYRKEVAHNIVDAILKMKATKGVPAVYRPQEEQEERLIEAYQKWEAQGSVWTAAVAEVCHPSSDCFSKCSVL